MIFLNINLYNDDNPNLILNALTLFDTGASISVITKNKANALNLNTIGNRTVTGLGGSNIYEYVNISVIYNKKQINIGAIIYDEIRIGNTFCDFIIGNDIYKNSKFDYDNGIFNFEIT